ncbi:hypothetical protein JCM10207_003897 [Rhodosporidiobolus poonsookiae]
MLQLRAHFVGPIRDVVHLISAAQAELSGERIVVGASELGGTGMWASLLDEAEEAGEVARYAGWEKDQKPMHLYRTKWRIASTALAFTPTPLKIGSASIRLIEAPAYMFRLLDYVLFNTTTAAQMINHGRAQELLFFYLLERAAHELSPQQHERWVELCVSDIPAHFTQRALEDPHLARQAREVLTDESAHAVVDEMMDETADWYNGPLSCRRVDLRRKRYKQVEAMFRALRGLVGGERLQDVPRGEEGRRPPREGRVP